ncbi:MAG: DMT family transporter [Burkholderiales bacterium]|nr:DMT family transporter [Burkholderiales bacterium]
MSGGTERPWIRLMPGAFVFLWATGFIGARFGLPYAPPATFLLIRFALVVALMLPAAIALRAPWPASGRQIVHIAVTGMLLHGGYLGGVFAAMDLGMSTGLAALIVGLQPLLTALAAARILREAVSARQWLGLALGLGGVGLVVLDKVAVAALSSASVAMTIIALASITAGTLYQKRYCGAFDLRTGSVIQFVAAALVVAPFAIAFEAREVRWTGEFVFAVAWLVIVLSLGAISLLTLLIRRGAATRVASLFYLVPPVTALIAYFVFGETLSATAVAGMAVAVVGVALVVAR